MRSSHLNYIVTFPGPCPLPVYPRLTIFWRLASVKYCSIEALDDQSLYWTSPNSAHICHWSCLSIVNLPRRFSVDRVLGRADCGTRRTGLDARKGLPWHDESRQVSGVGRPILGRERSWRSSRLKCATMTQYKLPHKMPKKTSIKNRGNPTILLKTGAT